MDPRRLRRRLFALVLFAVPFPYWVVEGGRVPAAWLVAVASLSLTAALTQGGSVSARISHWLAAEAIAVVVAAYLLARLLAAVLGRVVPAGRQRLAVTILAMGALAAVCLPIFSSTAVNGGAPTTLLGIFRLR